MRAPERTFGQQLRRLRVERGLTQQTLAERAGLATRAVAALEGGARRRPYPHTVAVLAEALGLVAHERASFTELAGRVAPPAAPAVAVAWLPVWPTALVGREDEVRAICGLLHPEGSAVRLLSLVGPGGVGKTRLAVAAAAALVPHYPDGVVFVDLAPVREPRFVAATIARALKLREAGAREQLPAYLHARQLLLVLDNFEHLLGAGPLLAKLLAECPAVALLVTSRAALHLRGEQRFPVAPLATPVDGSASLEAIGGAPAVRLFVERARAADPAFVLEATNAQAVAGVCRRLEGLPLTLELAAARASLLSPEALLRRLERRLPVLTGGAADLPERQQTLRSTLVWSFDLLEPAAQVLFRRLAVFVGGWTLEAAEAICADATLAAGDVLNRLQELVDSSLVRRLETGTREPRYGQLETVREYAGEELVTSGELERIRAAHAVFYTRLAEPAAAAQTSAPWIGGQASALTDAALDRLEAELDNLQAALDWWATTGRPAEGLHLAVGLSPLWSRRGHYAAGRRWLEALLELADQPAPAGTLSPTPATATALPAEHALALMQAGSLASTQGDIEQARSFYRRSVEAWRALDQTAGLAIALANLGLAEWMAGESTPATVLLEEALARSRAANLAHTVAISLRNLGLIARSEGQYAHAEALFGEAAEQALPVGWFRDYSLARSLSCLGRVASLRHDLPRASALLRQALEVIRQAHTTGQALADCLDWQADLETQQGDPARAVRLFGAADSCWRASGVQRYAPDQAAYERDLAEVCAALDERAFTAGWAEGGAMRPEHAIAYALLEVDAEAPPRDGRPSQSSTS